ncbi:MAG: mechanosensitive ion channel domain-containing protein [Candidatus Bathyarchaeia archaeon]
MQKVHQTRASIISEYIGWAAIRIGAIIILFILLEVICKLGLFAFFGDATTEALIYEYLQKIIFSGIIWFFLALSRKMIIPATIMSVTPAVGKIVRDPDRMAKTNKSLTTYLTYLVYIIAIIGLILIWAYSFIGTWVADLLGNGLVIMVTFILGLFSSSVLGNVLGFAILDGTNEFKVGDRVQIGESTGDVVEIGVFFTRIKTIKDEIISIPNLTVMGKEIRNLSALKQVLLYVQVTLGYDLDKDHARQLLIESARRTKGILLKRKPPFVLLRDLGVYNITYEINAYINEPNRMVEIKSELIDNILTDFKKAGVDILSPTHISLRNSENSTLPLNKIVDGIKQSRN